MIDVYLLELGGKDKDGNWCSVLKIGSTKRNFWARWRDYYTHTAYRKYLGKIYNLDDDMEKRIQKVFEEYRYLDFNEYKQTAEYRNEMFYWNDDIINFFSIMKNSDNLDRTIIFSILEFLIACFKILKIDDIDDRSLIKLYTDYKLDNVRKTIKDYINIDLYWFRKMKSFFIRVNRILHEGLTVEQ